MGAGLTYSESCTKIQFESESQPPKGIKSDQLCCTKIQFESESQPDLDKFRDFKSCTKIQFESESQLGFFMNFAV